MKCYRIALLRLCLAAVVCAGRGLRAEDDAGGVLVHEIESPYQSGMSQVRVLLPDKLASERRYIVVYVLPVEARGQRRYGDGLLEIKNNDLHNKHQAIFVAPDFSHLPWYADHPTDSAIRQESHFLKVVVPLVESSYPALAESKGRLLLGFSKSGWGAWSLLLRHPEMFGYAVAWDAPLMMDRPGKFGSAEIFANAENFREHNVALLLRSQASALRASKRFALLGYHGFRADHQQMHALMSELQIAHDYRDTPRRQHDWHSGWVPEAVELLLGERR